MSSLAVLDLHPYLQIEEDDVKSMSKLSVDENDERKTNSVRCEFTFQTQSGTLGNDPIEEKEKSENESVNSKLQK